MAFRGAFCCLSLFISISLSVAADDAGIQNGEDVPPTKAEIVRRLKALTGGRTLRSASGHFLVVGTNRAENLAFAGWAEDTATRLDKVVGTPSPFDSRTIRVVIRSGSKPPEGKILVHESRRGNEFVQRLTLWNHRRVDVEEARRVLCRLLIAGHLRSTIRKSDVPAGADIGVSDAVPLWLAEGLAQHIDPNLRGPNTLDVIGRWQKGRLASVVGFLRADGKVLKVAGSEEAVLDSGMSAVLVNWLLTRGDRRELFREIIRALDAGTRIDGPWLARRMGKTAGPWLLEEAWDYWLHGRRRVVYRPGEATPQAVAMLKARLLIYPGNCGIPLTVDFGGVAGFGDLIARREEEWVGGFCRKKARALKLLAFGRGERFEGVSAKYCEFLEALRDGGAEEKLRGLLREAEEMLKELDLKSSP